MSRQVQGYSCNICGKFSGDLTKAKAHMEAKHFPSSTGYTCHCCDRWFKTKNALSIHMSREHRDRMWTGLKGSNGQLQWMISFRETELSWGLAQLLWKGRGWNGSMEVQPVPPVCSSKSTECSQSRRESPLSECFSILLPQLRQGLLHNEGHGSAQVEHAPMKCLIPIDNKW